MPRSVPHHSPDERTGHTRCSWSESSPKKRRNSGMTKPDAKSPTPNFHEVPSQDLNPQPPTPYPNVPHDGPGVVPAIGRAGGLRVAGGRVVVTAVGGVCLGAQHADRAVVVMVVVGDVNMAVAPAYTKRRPHDQT